VTRLNANSNAIKHFVFVDVKHQLELIIRFLKLQWG
jgi:hypothetical protein